ncbi:unnamed protein product, partial [Durusdinium trenchii]
MGLDHHNSKQSLFNVAASNPSLTSHRIACGLIRGIPKHDVVIYTSKQEMLELISRKYPLLDLDDGGWAHNERAKGLKKSGKKLDRTNHSRKIDRKKNKRTHKGGGGGRNVKMTADNYERFEQVVQDLKLPVDRINKLWAKLMQLEVERQHALATGATIQEANDRIEAVLAALEKRVDEERSKGNLRSTLGARLQRRRWADIMD